VDIELKQVNGTKMVFAYVFFSSFSCLLNFGSVRPNAGLMNWEWILIMEIVDIMQFPHFIPFPCCVHFHPPTSFIQQGFP
jgi:hypothetical protein